MATSSFTSLTLLTFPTRVTIDRFFITGSVSIHIPWMSTCTAADMDAALEDLLDQHDALYHRQVDDLSTPQLNYLRALLNGVERMTTKETIDTYEPGSSANVKRVSTAL